MVDVRGYRPAESDRFLVRATIISLVLVVVWGCYAPVLRAQSDQTAGRYTFVLTGIPLMEALNRLVDRTDINLIYESNLVTGKKTYCRARNKRLGDVLSCILKDTGLDYYLLSSGTYVLFSLPREPTRYGTLTGQVVDADTGMPVPDANVMLAYEDAGTASNRGGRFSFADVKPGPHVLVITHVAYEDLADSIWIDPGGMRRVRVSLKEHTMISTPVVVNGFTRKLPSERLGTGQQAGQALIAMRTAGTVNMLRNLGAMAGVRVGNALSEVHVQGGAAGEHQYLLDGATVFVPIENGGFIGPFSPYAIRRVTVRKAGFGVSHGSHLAGVIEVEQVLAPARKLETVVDVDPMSLNVRVNGRSAKHKGKEIAWMVAGRYGLWGVVQPKRLSHLFETWQAPDVFLSRTLTGGPVNTAADSSIIVPPVNIGFSDLHAATRLRLNSLHSLHASFYRGHNQFGDDFESSSSGEEALQRIPEDGYSWDNTMTQLHYEGVLSGRLLFNAGAWLSQYRFRHPFNLGPFSPTPCVDSCTAAAQRSSELNDISEVGFRIGWNFAATAKHFLSGGLEAIHTDSDFSLFLDLPGAATSDMVRPRIPIPWRGSAYLEDAWNLGNGAVLTLGNRLTYLPARQTVYAEPRLSFRFDRPIDQGGAWAMRLSVGMYRQFLEQFDVATFTTTALVPSVRFWLPLSRQETPPRAYHFTTDLQFAPNRVWQITLESFVKWQPHLLVLDYAGRQTTSPFDLLTHARGFAYGSSLKVSRKTRRLQLTAQYEYGVARRRIANRFDGAYEPVPWDVPHRWNLAASYRFGEGLSVSLRWEGNSGRFWGFRQAYYDYLEPNPATRFYPPYNLADPEAHHIPYFSQWDAGVAYAREVAGLGIQFRFQLLNVFGRDNVRDWSLYFDSARQRFVTNARTATPFLPFFSLQLQR